MSFSINGIALDNSDQGWALTANSKTLSNLTRNVQSLAVPGADGVEKLPSTVGPVTFQLAVLADRGSDLESLYALFDSDELTLTVTGDTSKEIDLELLSSTPKGFGAGEAVAEAVFTVRANYPFWRDHSTTTTDAVSLSSSSVDVSVFSGVSAPIPDALIRVKGSAGGLRVTDSRGSWFSYSDAIASGSYLIYDCDTGSAVVVDSDTWTGGTDVTGSIDYSGGPSKMRITPSFTTDPSTRAGVLTVTTTSRSGASVQIRGRSAYVIV